MNNQNYIQSLVFFDSNSPNVFIRSNNLMHNLLQVYIQNQFDIEVEWFEVSELGRSLINLYNHSKPNFYGFNWYPLEEGNWQTVYSMRGIQPYYWTKLFTQPPHLPWRNTTDLLALLAGGTGASPIPPSSSCYLISFNGIKISFQLKCNLPVIAGSPHIRNINMSGLNEQQLTNIGAICETDMTVWNITNPLHSGYIDQMLHFVTTVDPAFCTGYWFNLLPVV